MEETMRVLTFSELLRLRRTELCARAAKIAAALPTFREGSPQRLAAQINLCNIRRILARRDFSPWAGPLWQWPPLGRYRSGRRFEPRVLTPISTMGDLKTRSQPTATQLAGAAFSRT
jgi:hypothetical protein